MHFVFQCGACGWKFAVDQNRIKNGTTGRYCPNCGSEIPKDVQRFAQTLANMREHPNSENWQLYSLPDEFTTTSAPWTFFLK